MIFLLVRGRDVLVFKVFMIGLESDDGLWAKIGKPACSGNPVSHAMYGFFLFPTP